MAPVCAQEDEEPGTSAVRNFDVNILEKTQLSSKATQKI